MEREYIIGTKPIPAWCRDRLMPYMKADGSVGWEFYGKHRSYDLDVGDALLWVNDSICVDKKKRV